MATPSNTTRSQSYIDVMGNPPKWLLRYGITAIAIGLLLLLLTGFVVKYPEAVDSPIRLETSNPPKDILSPSRGEIIDLQPENSIVDSGMVVGTVVDGYGEYSAILELENILTNGNFETADLIPFEEENLGPVQVEFFQFLQYIRGWTNPQTEQFYSNNSYQKNIRELEKEIAQLRKQIQEKEDQLSEIPERRERLKSLFDDNPTMENVAPLEQLLNEERELKREKKRDELEVRQKQREINEREFERRSKASTIQNKAQEQRSNIEISKRAVLSKIREWRDNHLMVSPIRGTLVYQNKIKAKEYTVDRGTPLLAVIPENAEDKIEGKLYLSSNDISKITFGQTVKISFPNYNPSSYGLLTGKIVDKATVPRNGQYLVRVALEDGMKSSKGQTIPFEHQMQGTAKIITTEEPFIYYILEHLRQLLWS